MVSGGLAVLGLAQPVESISLPFVHNVQPNKKRRILCARLEVRRDPLLFTALTFRCDRLCTTHCTCKISR